MTEPSRAVFLSYASQDVEAARRICDALRAAGIEVWFDQRELRGGDAWDHKIRQQIRDCALFIPIISVNAQARSEGYFRLEWRLADQRTHLMGKSRAFLVPVCVDDTREVDADIPDSFASVHWTRLGGGETPPAFVERIARLRESAHRPGPSPTILEPAAVPGLLPMPSVPSDKPSLAVLPFANMSSDPEQDYFADGMTEELITTLSKLSGILVIGRHSVFVYKGIVKDIRDIARELGVRYLLEGTVRRAGSRVRITTQLVEAASGTQIWAERYDREVEDIFALQDDVTRRIVDSLQVRLSDAESDALVLSGTASIEAHDYLLRGLERYWEFTAESLAASQALFARAVELDSHYASAHAWLARACVYRYSVDQASEETLEIALLHSRKAVEIDSRLPLGHSVLGWTQMWRGKATEAIGATRRAVTMDPNNPDAHFFLSVVLASAGRSEEGLQYIQKAMRLNPHPTVHSLFALGHCYYTLERLEEAASAFNAGVELRPSFTPNRDFLARTYLRLGRKTEAAEQRDALEKMGWGPGHGGSRSLHLYLDKRRHDEEAQLLTRLDSLR
jgi:TolB-like protein/Tfp pilus assembly protein PilF